MQDRGVFSRLRLRLCCNGFCDGNAGGDSGGQCGDCARARHDGVVDQGEGLIDPGVHLNRGPARVAGQCGDQARALAGHRTLLRRSDGGVRKHLHRSGFHQRGQIGLSGVLPDVPAVGHGDVGTGDQRRAVGGEVRIEPVLLALEPRRGNVGVVLGTRGRGEQCAEVQVVAVHVELRHGRHHRVDLVGLAGQRRNQLSVMQTGRRRRQTHLHQRHRIRRQLQEGGVAVVHGVADAVGEVDAVPQSLLPVVHVVDHLAGADVVALVHGGEVAELERKRFDALQFGGQFAQQRVHLLGVAGALGLKLAGELALLFAALDDRVDLGRRTTDDRLRRRGVDAHLQTGEIREHRRDLVGGVLDQRHQPDVLPEEHRLALAHEMRTRADGPGGISQ